MKALFNNKRVKSPKRHDNLKCVCTNKQSIKLHDSKLTALKGEIDKSTILLGNASIPFSVIDRTSREKMSKVTEGLNITNQLDLTFIEHHSLSRIHILLKHT
jgi:hypothetical protein